jgi:hypothetical protein
VADILHQVDLGIELIDNEIVDGKEVGFDDGAQFLVHRQELFLPCGLVCQASEMGWILSERGC